MSFELPQSLARQVQRRPVSAKAVIVHRNRVLLLRRPIGLWDLPGGKVEKGESVTGGLAREIREETGLKVTPDEVLACHVKPRDGLKDLLVISFLCSAPKNFNRSAIRLSEEHDACLLARFEKALRQPLRVPFATVLKVARRRL
jgi:8-oxo-dGTP pyrophosphatase MutT (NUDIX family)